MQNIEGETLDDYLDYLDDINNKVSNSNELILNIIFQLIYALFILNYEWKIIHNDLHFGNIQIKKLDKSRDIIIKFNSIQYNFKTNYQMGIYDYDRSFIEGIPNNYISLNNPNKIDNVGGFENAQIDKDLNQSFIYDNKSVLYRDLLYVLIQIFLFYRNLLNPLKNLPDFIPTIKNIATKVSQMYKTSEYK